MSASEILARRYIAVIAERHPDPFKGNKQMDHAHLTWMCEVIMNHHDLWPADKVGRWIGFVQGVLAAQGLIDINVERDFSRPLFHREYARMGIDAPDTIGRG
ncbi:hypothetical protein vBRpoSV10_213 [Ruegeria phage vB_RpoS-V10]|nr:hypothetical protein DSS3P8_208 [Roseobacter phage DSS3P8]AWY09335.1 hypothetical protein vBRpoSV10_213 [Ruegeria phage vB_RpoS-V10]